MKQPAKEHFRKKILELIRDFPEAADRLHYLRNYVAESFCGGHHTQETGQSPGPHRPTGRFLAYILTDVLSPDEEIAAVAIKGQGGGLAVTTYSSPEGETVHRFNTRGLLDVLND